MSGRSINGAIVRRQIGGAAPDRAPVRGEIARRPIVAEVGPGRGPIGPEGPSMAEQLYAAGLIEEATTQAMVEFFAASIFGVLTYQPITAFGATTAATDNKPAFDAADAAGQPVFVKGAFHTSVLPTGRYFGPGVIVLIDSGEVVPLADTPQRVNTKLAANLDRRLNFGAGQLAGAFWTSDAQANLALGNRAQRLNETGVRCVAAGWGAMEYAPAPGISTAIGDSAFRFSLYLNRSDAFGSNAGKWIGDPNPQLHGHDFFDSLWGQHDEWAALWPDWLSVVTVDGTITGAIIASCVPTADEHSQTNLCGGRDALLHMIKGNDNTIWGAHAGKGWNNNFCAVFGSKAAEHMMTNDHIVAIGGKALNGKMTGDDDCGFGYNVAPLLVHGWGNLLGGSNSLPLFNGDSLDKSTVDARIFRNVFWGNDGGDLLKVGAQNAVLGANFAQAAYRLENVAAAGFGVWANVYATFNSVALGYRAGQNNRSSRITASIAGTTMTVTEVLGAPLQVGDTIRKDPVLAGTKIVSGPVGGGPGDYQLSLSQPAPVPSQVMVIGLYNSNAIGNQVGGLTRDNSQKLGQQIDDTTISGRTYTSWRDVTRASAGDGNLSAMNILQAIVTRSGATAAFTDTTDTAAALIAAMPAAEVNSNTGTATGAGTSFECWVRNTTGYTMTIAGGAGVTLAGAATIAAGASAYFRGIVTSTTSPAVKLFRLGA